MSLRKGKTNNPNGRPKGLPTTNYKAIFDAALDADCKKYKQHLIVKIVQMARDGDVAMCRGIIQRLLPELKAVDMKIDGSSPFKLIIDMQPKDKNTKQSKVDKNSIEYE